METIELIIDKPQKEKLQQLCINAGESEESYIAMAQILLNEAIDKE